MFLSVNACMLRTASTLPQHLIALSLVQLLVSMMQCQPADASAVVPVPGITCQMLQAYGTEMSSGTIRAEYPDEKV